MKKIIPYPWLTNSAVRFLETHLNDESVVLEFGMGGSTIWLADRVKELTSVEHSCRWYRATRRAITRPFMPVQHPRPYASVCDILGKDSFDLVLVDGRDRVECVLAAMPLLKTGGVMMLDDAGRRRYRKAHDAMKTWDYVATKQRQPSPPHNDVLRTDWWFKPRQDT